MKLTIQILYIDGKEETVGISHDEFFRIENKCLLLISDEGDRYIPMDKIKEFKVTR